MLEIKATQGNRQSIPTQGIDSHNSFKMIPCYFRDLRVGKIRVSVGEMLGVLRKRVRKTQTMHFCLASSTGQIALGAD